MYSLSLKHGSPARFITQLANSQDVEVSDNKLLLERPLGTGYFQAHKLANGCECLVSDYRLKEDLYLRKFSLPREFFILRIDEIIHAANSVVMVDGSFSSERKTKNYSLVFLSSLSDFLFIAPKKSHVRSIEISIPADWLYKRLNVKNGKEKLSLYIRFKNRKSLIRFVTPSVIRQFKAILTSGHQAGHISLKKEIDSLLENFILNLTDKLQEVEKQKKIKIIKGEVRRLLEVKDYLVQDLSLPPSFSDLQHVAAMSGTTLKTKFKKMFGVTIYEYFQHLRMEKAGILLRSDNYTIKEVGRQMGYANLSNFSTAFRKVFDLLPRQYIQHHRDLTSVDKAKSSLS